MPTEEELEEMATPYPEPKNVQKTEAELSYNMPRDTQQEFIEEPAKKESMDNEIETQASYFRNQPSLTPVNDIELNNVKEHKANEDIIEPEPKEIQSESKVSKHGSNDRLNDMDSRLDTMQKTLKDLKEQNERRDIQIESAMRANIEFILVDMQTIADDLNIADTLLNNIGTEEHFNKIYYEKTNRGINMALMAAVRYLEDAASNAKQIIPIHQSIKSNMNAVNEKLKYGEDA